MLLQYMKYILVQSYQMCAYKTWLNIITMIHIFQMKVQNQSHISHVTGLVTIKIVYTCTIISIYKQ